MAPKTNPRRPLLAAGAALGMGLLIWATAARGPRSAKAPVIEVLAVCADGSGFAAGTSQGTIYVCRSGEGIACQALMADGRLNDLRFSDSGELVIADRNLRLLKGGQAQPARLRNDWANYGAVRIDNRRRRILTINGTGTVMTVEMDAGRARRIYCCSSIWGDVEFLDDGERAASAGHWPAIWDLGGNRLVGRLTERREVMTFGPIAVDTPAGLLYMGSQDGRVYQWRTDSRELLRKSLPLPGYVMTASVLGTSGWVAYAARPGPVHIWHPERGSHRVVEAARTSSNLVFDHARNLAVLGTEAGSIEYWDLPSERLVESRLVGR